MKTQTKLPKRFKEKWVKALRSGEYEQGQDELYNEKTNNFCCLGVAANICGISTKRLNYVPLLSNWYFSEDEILKENKNLPKVLIGSNEKEDDDYSAIVEKLVNFNDNGKSFNWIASYIERYL